jgi:hypothetical protein
MLTKDEEADWKKFKENQRAIYGYRWRVGDRVQSKLRGNPGVISARVWLFGWRYRIDTFDVFYPELRGPGQWRYWSVGSMLEPYE